MRAIEVSIGFGEASCGGRRSWPKLRLAEMNRKKFDLALYGGRLQIPTRVEIQDFEEATRITEVTGTSVDQKAHVSIRLMRAGISFPTKGP